MKNSEIHIGLDQSEVRDFLAQQLENTWNTSPKPENMPSPNTMEILDWAILSAKNAGKLAAAQVKNLEEKKAVNILIKKMGWQEFDVSEMTTKDMDSWWSFIGTEEEYKQQFKIK